MSDTTSAGRATVLGFRTTTVAWAILGALAFAVVAVTLVLDQTETDGRRVGGDFPAFYAAGSIVLSGDVDQLYDAERQVAEQAPYLGGVDGYLPFVNPPPVAAAYAVLALLPYEWAYLVHSALMVGAAILAYRLLEPLLPPRRPPAVVIAAVAFTFIPMLGIVAGQNTALTILAVAAAWRFLHDGRGGLAGLAIGLLLFKPQYAVPLAGLFLVRGQLRAVAAFAATSVGWWLSGVAMLGLGWLTQWVDEVTAFNVQDAGTNAKNAVSWLGLAENAFGAGSPTALVLGAIGIAVTAGILIAIWRRGRTPGWALPFAAAAAGILLTSPHAMFYDAGLLSLTAAGLWIAGFGLLRPAVVIVWLLGLSHIVLTGPLGFSPVALAVIGSFGVAVWFWRLTNPPPGRQVEVRTKGSAPTHSPALSVIVPAFDEAGRIEPTLEELATWLVDENLDAEVLVVDDGSNDDTAARSFAFADRLPHLRVLSLERNCGKGRAVRVGMLAAVGRRRAFIDADGSTAPGELARLLESDAAVVIGSVAVDSAIVAAPQSTLRSTAGRFGNRLIQGLVLPGIEDSQRGCKVFTGDAAEAVFSACVVDGWGFDVEALARVRALGHEPDEVGITWEDRPVGHVRPWHYATTMLEVLGIRALVGKQPARPRVVHRVVEARPEG